MENYPWLKHYPEGLKYISGDYPEVSLYSFFDNTVKKYPKNTALIFFDRKTYYEILDKKVNAFANSLKELGVTRNDKIALILPNCPQFVIAYFAILKLGAAIVPLNPLFSAKEIHYCLNDCQAKIVLTLDTFSKKVLEAKENTKVEKIIFTNISDEFPLLLKLVYRIKTIKDYFDNRIVKEYYSFTKSFQNTNPLEIEPINPKIDCACLMYTSGTTGEPKGVPLTHYNLTSNVFQISDYITDCLIEGEDSQIGVLPFFHIYGLTFVLNLSIFKAFPLALLPKFNTKPFLKEIDKNKINVVAGIPAIYSALLKKNIAEYDLSSVKFWGCGAASCSAKIIEAIKDISKGIFIEAYGLTETSPIVIMNPPKGMQKIESIGIPLPNTFCKVIDEKTGVEMGINQIGELIVKGPQVFDGYWKKEKSTQVAIDRNGWFHTKDIASIDEDGFFYIKGRLDDMINVRGEKVWPQDIEDVLKQHPLISDAAVIGIKDDYYGQFPKAFVVAKENINKDNIKEFCKKHLADFKIPKEIEFVNEIPKSALGKTLHYILKN